MLCHGNLSTTSFLNLSVESFVQLLVAVLHQHTGLVYPWPVPVCDSEARGTVHDQRFVPGCVCEGNSLSERQACQFRLRNGDIDLLDIK